jgi:hypothetical protein
MEELVRKNPWVHPVSLVEWLGPIIQPKQSRKVAIYDRTNLLGNLIALAEQNELALAASPQKKK